MTLVSLVRLQRFCCPCGNMGTVVADADVTVILCPSCGEVATASAGDEMPVKDEVTPPDIINHPPHYTSHPSGVECIDVVEHYPFNVGAAIKYLWRAGLKGDAIEDLKKAAWYCNREIARRTRDSR